MYWYGLRNCSPDDHVTRTMSYACDMVHITAERPTNPASNLAKRLQRSVVCACVLFVCPVTLQECVYVRAQVYRYSGVAIRPALNCTSDLTDASFSVEVHTHHFVRLSTVARLADASCLVHNAENASVKSSFIYGQITHTVYCSQRLQRA